MPSPTLPPPKKWKKWKKKWKNEEKNEKKVECCVLVARAGSRGGRG
jgi:hypothetical protein